MHYYGYGAVVEMVPWSANGKEAACQWTRFQVFSYHSPRSIEILNNYAKRKCMKTPFFD